MKVVLFCGGLGTRLRDYSETIPKPMVKIGYRPILWHIMKYYAHYGHKEFILCLGYKADMFKQYFVNYNEFLSNDFVLSNGGREMQIFNKDIEDWKITFVDTGVKAIVGERLMKVRSYLEGEERFLAHYTDTLSDCHLPDIIDFSEKHDATATFLAAQSTQSFHVAQVQDDGLVENIAPISDAGFWINGGFFVLKNEIFDYMKDGEELVVEPFHRLIQEDKLVAYKYKGFWAAMDTFKDKMMLDNLYAQGNPPWEVWNQPDDHSRELEAVS